MTDQPDQPNPWDAPADPAQPGGQPGAAPQPDQPAQHPAPPYGQQAPPYGYAAPPGGGYGQQAAYPPQPPPPPYGQQPPPYGYPAPAVAYGQQPYYGPTTSSKATAVLVLGILSLVLTFGCIGFILAIVALVMAPGARREIEESGGRLTGESQIKAGKITSWITLGLTALGIAASVVILVVAVSNSDNSGNPPASRVRTNATSLVHGVAQVALLTCTRGPG